MIVVLPCCCWLLLTYNCNYSTCPSLIMKVCGFQTFTCVLHSLVVCAQLSIATVINWNDIGIINL